MRRPVMNGGMKTLLLIVSLAFNFGACLALGVQRYGDSPAVPARREGEPHRERSWRLPDLTPDQSAVMEASREALFDGIRELKREMVAESETLANMLVAPEPDMAAVSEQAARISALRDQIQQRMIEHFISLRGALEPDQLDAFKQMIQRRFADSGRRGMRGEMHGGRGEHEKRSIDGDHRRGRERKPLNPNDDG